MDSPLTTAEISRLRKSIQQRDRLVSQGASTSAPDLNISRALTNLKMYLPQSQSQLTVVLKDWNDGDQAKKSEIVGWIRLNILNDQTPARATTPATTFVPPPPPPTLLPRANTLPSQFQSAPSLPTYTNSPVSERAPSSPWSNPAPSPRPQVTPTYSFIQNQTISTPTPPRELFTQATRQAPTPPPKDKGYSLNSSTLYSNAPVGPSPRPALNTQSFYGSDSRQNGSNVSMSPLTTTQSPLSSVHAPVDTTRQLNSTYNISPNVSTNTGASIYQQSVQPAQPQSPIPNIPLASNSYNTNPTSTSLVSSQGVAKAGKVLAQLATAYMKHSSSGTHSTPQASNLHLMLEIVKKYQDHQSHHSSNIAQYQSGNQPPGTDPMQMFQAMQQQQQQQGGFDPNQFFSQFQMQGNSPSGTGFDWSSLTGGSGIDMNSILSGMGSGGDNNVDWGSIADMMGGMDLSTAMDCQDSGNF